MECERGDMPPSAHESEAEADGDSNDDDESRGDGQAPGGPPKKKARGTKVEQAQKKCKMKEAQLAAARQAVAVGEAKNSKVQRDVKALERAREKVAKFERELELLARDLQVAQDAAVERANIEKKREELRVQKEEDTRHMSDAGAMMLVEIRLSYQSRFDNTSDKADAIWAHIHSDFMKKVNDGDLPQSDARNVQALEKRFQTELGEFRLWAAQANRAVSYSGVPADQVEELVRNHYRVTTPLFRKSNFEQRPMSVPPWQVNSESAMHGGDGNVLGGSVSGNGDDDEDEMDEDDEDWPHGAGRGRGRGRGGRRGRGRGAVGGAPGGLPGGVAGGVAGGASDGTSGGEVGGVTDGEVGGGRSSSRASSSASGLGSGSGSARMAGGPRDPTPVPLHIGGASGKSRSTHQPAPLADFIEVFKGEQEENRRMMKAMQDAQFKEAEEQRKHEEHLASQCKQQ
jgi:hypothetical protein